MKKILFNIVLIFIFFPGIGQNNIEPFKVLTGHKYKLNYLRFSDDSKFLVSGGWDNNVILWDMETFSKLHVLNGHTDWIREVDISPDNKFVVSGSHDGSIKIWDLYSGEMKYDIEPTPREFINKGIIPELDRKAKNAISALAFSPDGRYFAVGSTDDLIRILDSKSFELIHTLEGHGASVFYIDFSKNSDIMVSGAIYNELIVWDTKTFRPIRKLKEERGYNGSFQFFNNDKYLLNTGNSKINEWDIYEGNLIRSYPVQKMLQSVQLTTDEKYMFTCAEDHTLKLWDFNSGEELWSYTNTKPELADCKISPDGKYLALATPEGKILIWKLKDFFSKSRIKKNKVENSDLILFIL